MSATATGCPSCGHELARLKWQTFQNATRHIRAECSDCAHFLRYVPQSVLARALADLGGVIPIEDMLRIRRESEVPA